MAAIIYGLNLMFVMVKCDVMEQSAIDFCQLSHYSILLCTDIKWQVTGL